MRAIRTQFTDVTDKLYDVISKVESGSINPQFATVMKEIADTLVRGAIAHSQHQRLQRKIPYVKYFDEPIVELYKPKKGKK